MMIKNKFYILTLGCKVNQYESQAIREAWITLGWVETSLPEASVIVVNSCAITAKAVADVRAEIRRLHRFAPSARIFVTGCASTAAKDELKNIAGVLSVIDQQDKYLLLNGPQGLDPLDAKRVHSSKKEAAVAKENEAHGTGKHVFPPYAISGYSRSRAVLKIQDGCSHFCSYCIVPYTRGKSYSRPLQDSLSEVERLLAAGFREIMISGINLRQYKADGEKEHDFWSFIGALEKRFSADWQGIARFRISSLEPGQLNERALATLGSSHLIAPHLHLSLQSGSTDVLQRMRRGHYHLDGILEFLDTLKVRWPVFGLGVDLISGFPGETESEHEETLSLIERLPISYAHVFPFSVRPGTAAAKLSNHVSSGVKKARAAELRAVAAKKNNTFLSAQSLLEEITVAVENTKDTKKWPKNQVHGINEFYVECEFLPELSPPCAVKGLVKAKPVRVEEKKLIVAWGGEGE